MPKSKGSVFVGRYVGIDSHLIERNGSVSDVYGLAGERPAGKKLVKDIANVCNQLWSEGYEVSSIFPITSGRIVEATVEAAEEVRGRTYKKTVEAQETEQNPSDLYPFFSTPQSEIKHYVDTGAGYSVTDGVVIIGKRRNA